MGHLSISSPLKFREPYCGGKKREGKNMRIGIGGDWIEAQRAWIMNGNMQLSGVGKVGRGTSKKSQRPGMGKTPRSQYG